MRWTEPEASVIQAESREPQRLSNPAMKLEMKQALGAFALSTLAVALLGLLAGAIGFVNANLGALVAIVFLYISVWVARSRGGDLVDYGFHTSPKKKSLLLAGIYIAIVLPIFIFGYVFFYDMVCAKASSFSNWAPPGFCPRYQGWAGAHFPDLDWTFWELAFVQVIVVALPEELFFRGIIHELCERAIPPKRRIVGGGIGWALVLSSFLFAIGHLAVTFDARRLAVFFPALAFGWMRSATGSIFAGTIAHAISNLLIFLLNRVFF